MKKLFVLHFSFISMIAIITACTASEQPAPPAGEAKQESTQTVQMGKEEFQQHCAVCHPDGGNIIHAEKTLKKDVLAANNIKTPEDIIGKMRNPGPGMTKFDKETIPDIEARAIAEYVLGAFK